MSPRVDRPGPELTGIVVHWRAPEHLERLRKAWPDDPRFELLVVNNDDHGALPAGPGRVLESVGNAGFAGAVNLGLAATEAPLVLLLNPDATPLRGALESLLEGFERHPEAAGLAPALEFPDGTSQYRWQLRPLPSVADLLGQSLLLPFGGAPLRRPLLGEPVEQPAAAALALRLEALRQVGGLDPDFFPAWFEDVDLAKRLLEAGRHILYWPEARFEHALGSSVPCLGYGPFLWLYYRNLGRYLRKHHGNGSALLSRLLLVPAAILRTLLLPFRRPRRAASRREALRGLATLLAGAITGWRRPRRLARQWSRADPSG